MNIVTLDQLERLGKMRLDVQSETIMESFLLLFSVKIVCMETTKLGCVLDFKRRGNRVHRFINMSNIKT